MKVPNSLKQQIIEFLDKGDKFFINWLNGTCDKSSKDELNQLLHHDVKIMYSGEEPSLIDKEQLLKMLDSIHGRSAEQPIDRKNEILNMEKMSEELVLVTYLEHTTVNSETIRTRPLSVIITLDPLQLYYSHE